MKKTELRAVPDPETPKSRERIARRTTQRLHQLRLEGHFRMPATIHEIENRCAGCGTELSNYTLGCAHCVDRERKREERAA